MENGFFKTRKNGYTVTLNSVIRDETLSLSAKGLYLNINSYISIPDFKVSKDFIFKKCREGKKAFGSAWKELKTKGYLLQEFHPDPDRKGQFTVLYELLDEPCADGIHTRYFNTSGKVTKELYTDYHEKAVPAACDDDEKTETNSDSLKDKTDDRNLSSLKCTSVSHAMPQRTPKMETSDHVPQKGYMVGEDTSDRYPLKGITLKGATHNNNIYNNTKPVYISSSSDYTYYRDEEDKDEEKKESEESERKSSGQNPIKVFNKLSAYKLSALLVKYIKEQVIDVNETAVYKVSKNKSISRTELLEVLDSLSFEQLKDIDGKLNDGTIKTSNGIAAFLYNATFTAGKSRHSMSEPAAEKKDSGGYNQRHYTANDFADIEKRLLKNNGGNSS